MVGHRLSGSPKPLYGVPPLAVLAPLIDLAPDDKGGHCFWEGDFNREGEAVLRWKPAEHIPAYTYPVARALIHHVVGPIQPRSRVTSLCGVVACINPLHWGVWTYEEWNAVPRYIEQVDFDGKGWRVSHVPGDADRMNKLSAMKQRWQQEQAGRTLAQVVAAFQATAPTPV